ncbi:MAG: hypothetical protein MR006_06325 [Arcanobacterium sp.]|nr:hypothetical protein [Arcanobacterium sp.]MDY5588449.1 hypothetical protein [Arcanobacterium sp.]
MWHVFEPQSSSSSAALSTASDKNKASDFNSEVRSGITPRAAGAPDLTTTPVHVNPNVWLDPRYANGAKKVDLGGEFLAADSQHRTALIFSPHGGELVVDIATQKPALTLSDNVFCEGLVAYGDRVPCIESLAKRQSLLLLDLATRQIRTLATWDLKGDASYLTRVVAIDAHRIYTTSEIRSTTLAAYDIASGKRLWTQRTPLRYPECTVLSGHLGCWDKSGKSTIIEVRDHNTGLPTMNLSLPSNARFNWLWDGLVADNGAKNNTTLYSLSGATVGTLKGDSFPTQFTNNKLFESASVHSNPSVLHTGTTSDGTLLYWSRSGRTYLYPTQQEFRSLEATGNTADGALFSAVSRDGNASRTLIISKKGTLLTTINEKLKPMCGLLVGSDFHTVYLPIADSAS